MTKHLPAVVVLLLVGAAMPLASAGDRPDPKTEAPHEFYQLFEGATELGSGLRMIGIEPKKHVELDPAGLRITLPAGYPWQRPAVGLATSFGLKGDFEVTVGFEILHEERGLDFPDKIMGLSLEAIPQHPADRDVDEWMRLTQNKASLVRSVGARKITTFFAYAPQWDGKDGKDEPTTKDLRPTTAKAGRLRLARTGADLSYLVSEGAEQEFTLIRKDSFGQKDLNHVRVVATTWGTSAALTVRVKDLRIRAQSFSQVQPAIQPRAWWKPLIPVFVLVVVLSIGMSFAVWIYRRRKIPAAIAVSDAHASVTQPQANTEEAASVLFQCSGCAKKLKTKASMAGKKVKCRYCGQATQVPAAKPTDRNALRP